MLRALDRLVAAAAGALGPEWLKPELVEQWLEAIFLPPEVHREAYDRELDEFKRGFIEPLVQNLYQRVNSRKRDDPFFSCFELYLKNSFLKPPMEMAPASALATPRAARQQSIRRMQIEPHAVGTHIATRRYWFRGTCVFIGYVHENIPLLCLQYMGGNDTKESWELIMMDDHPHNHGAGLLMQELLSTFKCPESPWLNVRLAFQGVVGILAKKSYMPDSSTVFFPPDTLAEHVTFENLGTDDGAVKYTALWDRLVRTHDVHATRLTPSDQCLRACHARYRNERAMAARNVIGEQPGHTPALDYFRRNLLVWLLDEGLPKKRRYFVVLAVPSDRPEGRFWIAAAYGKDW